MLHPVVGRTLKEPIGGHGKREQLLSLEAVSKGGQILSSPKSNIDP